MHPLLQVVNGYYSLVQLARVQVQDHPAHLRGPLVTDLLLNDLIDHVAQHLPPLLWWTRLVKRRIQGPLHPHRINLRVIRVLIQIHLTWNWDLRQLPHWLVHRLGLILNLSGVLPLWSPLRSAHLWPRQWGTHLRQGLNHLISSHLEYTESLKQL